MRTKRLQKFKRQRIEKAGRFVFLGFLLPFASVFLGYLLTVLLILPTMNK